MVVDQLAAAYAQNLTQTQAQNYGHYNCVEWAKKLTNQIGIWGAGGALLTLNSDGQIGDVVIFKYQHVGVVIGRVGENLAISEANYDWTGKVRTRILSVYDPTIKGFHQF